MDVILAWIALSFPLGMHPIDRLVPETSCNVVSVVGSSVVRT